MERKDEAAVERQKLVDDGEVENEDEQTNITTNVPPTNAPKTVQTPNSPVLSNRVCISMCFIRFISQLNVIIDKIIIGRVTYIPL